MAYDLVKPVKITHRISLYNICRHRYCSCDCPARGVLGRWRPFRFALWCRVRRGVNFCGHGRPVNQERGFTHTEPPHLHDCLSRRGGCNGSSGQRRAHRTRCAVRGCGAGANGREGADRRARLHAHAYLQPKRLDRGTLGDCGIGPRLVGWATRRVLHRCARPRCKRRDGAVLLAAKK